MGALINSSSKINTMYPTYAIKSGLRTRKIDISIQKIDEFYLDIVKIVIVDFLVKNKLERV